MPTTPTNSKPAKSMIRNPIRPPYMLEALVITYLVAAKMFGLSGFESVLWMLGVGMLVNFKYASHIATRLEQLEKALADHAADEAERKRVEQLASLGRDPQGRFVASP